MKRLFRVKKSVDTRSRLCISFWSLRRGNVGIRCGDFTFPHARCVRADRASPCGASERALSAFYSRSASAQSCAGALCDARRGVSAFSVTALTCGQGTDRAQPRLSALPLRRSADATDGRRRRRGHEPLPRPGGEVAAIAPQRKQDASQATSQRDDGDAPTAPRRERVRPRPQRRAGGARPRQITHLACTSNARSSAGPVFVMCPLCRRSGGAVFGRHQPEKGTRAPRVAAKPRGIVEGRLKRQRDDRPDAGRRHQPLRDRVGARPRRRPAARRRIKPRFRVAMHRAERREDRRARPGARPDARRVHAPLGRSPRQPPALLPQHGAQQTDRPGAHPHQVPPHAQLAAHLARRRRHAVRAPKHAVRTGLGQRRHIAPIGLHCARVRRHTSARNSDRPRPPRGPVLRAPAPPTRSPYCSRAGSAAAGRPPKTCSTRRGVSIRPLPARPIPSSRTMRT